MPPEEEGFRTREELLATPALMTLPLGKHTEEAAKDVNGVDTEFIFTLRFPFFFSNFIRFVSPAGDITGTALSVGIKSPGSFFTTGCLFAYLKPGFWKKWKYNKNQEMREEYLGEDRGHEKWERKTTVM